MVSYIRKNTDAAVMLFFFLMIRRPPRSTLDRSSAASDVYKRQERVGKVQNIPVYLYESAQENPARRNLSLIRAGEYLSLIHISEPTRPY